MAYLSFDELRAIGFRRVGKDVKLSRKASVYNAANIELGDFVRIDDFCVLSAGAGGISIGRNVHVAVFSSLLGGGRIAVGDFANLSSRVSIFSSNDDYSGGYMTNPTVPAEFTNVTHAPVIVGRHVIVGSGSVILPGVTLGDGCAVGALSLIKGDCVALGCYAGVPARQIGRRGDALFKMEAPAVARLA